MAVAAAAMVVAGLVVASPAGADVIGPLQNQGNNKCFQPFRDSTEVGAAIVQHECTYPPASGRIDPFQDWYGACQNSKCDVVHVVNVGSGLCMRARGLTGPANGEDIMLWTCNKISDLNWTIQTPDLGDPNKMGATFESRLFGRSGFCLDVPGSTIEEDHALQLFECNGTDAQRWYRLVVITERAKR